MKHVKNLVVGCGLSGAVVAERLASQRGEEVLVIDSRDHIGGNVYDYRDESGICIHKYGSHIFNTDSAAVWEYMNRFTAFNTYMHEVIALIDGVETTIPFNLRTLYDVFPQSLALRLETKLLERFAYNTKVSILEFQQQEDEDLRFLARYIYEKVFLHYTVKQWGRRPDEVDGAVTARVPVYISCDRRYFQRVYQGIPLDGYTRTVEKMLAHPGIHVQLNTDFAHFRNTISYDRLFYTGSIDAFFDYRLGRLPYRSVRFNLERHDREFYQSNAVVNYPCNYDFTRIHEYKHYLNDQTPRDQSPRTVIAKEYSEAFEEGKNDRYYPIPAPENTALYEAYRAEADKLKNVWFLGRLGDYRYYDMDAAVERALGVVGSV